MTLQLQRSVVSSGRILISKISTGSSTHKIFSPAKKSQCVVGGGGQCGRILREWSPKMSKIELHATQITQACSISHSWRLIRLPNQCRRPIWKTDFFHDCQELQIWDCFPPKRLHFAQIEFQSQIKLDTCRLDAQSLAGNTHLNVTKRLSQKGVKNINFSRSSRRNKS